jgi:hypothetical protein
MYHSLSTQDEERHGMISMSVYHVNRHTHHCTSFAVVWYGMVCA